MKPPSYPALLIAACLICSVTTADAKPAPYYKWLGSNKILCKQFSPGPGWKLYDGPYVKSDCSM